MHNAFKLLRCAFGKAVKWEVIKRNPFELVEKPKRNSHPRDIWGADTIHKALDECRGSKLYVAMNLSFACSLRIGEILGFTWDNIHITDEDIAADNAHLFGTPAQARTGGLRLRRLTLYPTELRAHICSCMRSHCYYSTCIQKKQAWISEMHGFLKLSARSTTAMSLGLPFVRQRSMSRPT